MPKWHMDGKGPKRLMKLEMLETLERFERPMEMRSLWPGERLFFFPRSGISASGPPASGAGCPDYRGHRHLPHINDSKSSQEITDAGLGTSLLVQESHVVQDV